ncbi:MAG: GNAT family N-acetyltransferase [Chloroflexaceae bacterium]|nr:GNAT family N-acetyltransferase [Chloroflexaceae bacterium]
MMMIREARMEDIAACAALQASYATQAVWQVRREGDPREAGEVTQGGPLISLLVQQVRLPQKRLIPLPSAMTPLERVWECFDARLVAVDDEGDEAPDDALHEHQVSKPGGPLGDEPPVLSHVRGVALLQVLPDQQQAMIARLLVDQPARGQGTGTALLRAARRWAAAEGFVALLAHVPLRNVPGIAFYLRRGFRVCGLHEHFYPTREDALLLVRGGVIAVMSDE